MLRGWVFEVETFLTCQSEFEGKGVPLALNFADTAPDLFARQELGKFWLPEISCWVKLKIPFPGDGVRR